MRIAMIFAAGALLVGCGDDIPPRGERGPAGAVGVAGPQGEPGAIGAQGPAGPQGATVIVSGSRLKARWRAGDDGSRAFIGWYDSELAQTCTFARSADDVERCLPDVNGLGGLPFYYVATAEDDIPKECSGAAIIIGGSPNLSAYYIRSETVIGDDIRRAHVYKVGGIVDIPAFVGVLNFELCTSRASWKELAADAVVHSVGEEIPASAFVASTVDIDK